MASVDTGTEQLLAVIDDGVATITFNRPRKRNALSDELTPALRESLLRFDENPEVRVVVLTGAGTAFCAGGDVSGMGSKSRPPGAVKRTFQDGVRELQRKQETLTLRLFDLSKPTIAALPGPAAGAGFSIALACDLRLAAESAFVTTAFANIGLSGDYGASWLLPQLVGIAKAKELFFTSRRVGAAEGLALGIFNEVVDDDRLAERTAELARTIADGPPVALRYMKENLNRAVGADLRTCLALEADRMSRSAQTEDHREAVAAFLGKRTPVFKGQ
ncbi:MAG: enoyl-CoA hydratase [Gammaproteobacteria bacterium]|nr:enoyl-CoA hydratase [Gammaproteobacteria bacterium]